MKMFLESAVTRSLNARAYDEAGFQKAGSLLLSTGV